MLCTQHTPQMTPPPPNKQTNNHQHPPPFSPAGDENRIPLTVLPRKNGRNDAQRDY